MSGWVGCEVDHVGVIKCWFLRGFFRRWPVSRHVALVVYVNFDERPRVGIHGASLDETTEGLGDRRSEREGLVTLALKSRDIVVEEGFLFVGEGDEDTVFGGEARLRTGTAFERLAALHASALGPDRIS